MSMLKTVLRRVKAGAFCARVRKMVEALPSFLQVEKELIASKLDVMEAQVNAVRRNEYLNALREKYVPNLWRMVRILKLSLQMAAADDAKAAELLAALCERFQKRMSITKTLLAVEFVCVYDAPEHEPSAESFAMFKEYAAEMLEINRLNIEEDVRISLIGRSIDTRMEIIDLLFRAMDIAKGRSYRGEETEEAKDAIDTLEGISDGLRRNLPRRKRKKRDGGVATAEENAASEAAVAVAREDAAGGGAAAEKDYGS